MKKILIIRFSSIGDIVLTTPVVRHLHAHFPNAEIHFATKASFKAVVQHNPYLHKLHLLGDNLSSLIEELKQEHFDFVVDLHHNQRTFLIKRALGLSSASFPKLNIQKWMLVNLKWNVMPNIHIVDRYMSTIAQFGITNDGKGLDYFFGNELPHESFDSTIHEKPFIAWVLGAKHNTKKFPKQKIVQVIEQLNLPVVLLGGKEDQQDADWIAQQLQQKAILISNQVGKNNINQSAAIVSKTTAVVSNDTGMMHIAAALKKPIVSIWGSTVPSFGMTPYYGNLNITNRIVESTNIGCRPCSKIGYERCPKGHFNCMNSISEAQVVQAIQAILK